MGAPTEPGSDVAFSRETVSTAEFLSSTDTARTYLASVPKNINDKILIELPPHWLQTKRRAEHDLQQPALRP